MYLEGAVSAGCQVELSFPFILLLQRAFVRSKCYISSSVLHISSRRRKEMMWKFRLQYSSFQRGQGCVVFEYKVV